MKRLMNLLISGECRVTQLIPVHDGVFIVALDTPEGHVEMEVEIKRALTHENPEDWERIYRERVRWTQDELILRRLPLYWSREWLVARMINYGNLERVSQVTGYPVEALRNWKRKHDIHGNPQHDALRKAWDSGAYQTKRELSQAYDVSEATVSNLLGNGREVFDDPLAENVRALMLQGVTQAARVIYALDLEKDSPEAGRVRRLLKRFKEE